MKPILLYGPPGSGKSTVGKFLAKKLELRFVDLDVVIEQKAGMPISDFIAKVGEPAFRDAESTALQDVLNGDGRIIALGGGALLRDENRALAESAGTIVCLYAKLETLLARLSDDDNRRPLLAGNLEQKLPALLEKRGEHYRSFSPRFDSAHLDPAQIAWQIQVTLGHFRVGGMGQAYDAIVERGGIDRLGELLRERNLNGPVVVVTESNVGPLYAERAAKSLRAAGCETTIVSVPAGEANKTLDSIQSMWRGFLQAGLDRRSTVVALGGGVVGDMAGFAASTFMRGVNWVGVPTSLLAMVDASLGGKTGIDLPEGKNLVGAFHPPRLVLADPNLLASLPVAELRSGLAEVVKHGIISDPGLFELCASGYEAVKSDLDGIVRRAMAVKIAVIETDPYERGMRAALNLGHTVGHAVELVSEFRLRHGEAIAIGTVVEARLAERLGRARGGLSEQIAVTFAELGLPTRIPPELPREAIIQAMKVDKKKSSGVVKFALPVEIGRVDVGVSVEDLNMIFE
jgi:shikimate kinase / 3-dehydroquinate synthase